MKRTELLGILKQAQAACNKNRGALEELRMVLLFAANGELVATGTDGYDCFLQVRCKASVSAKGKGFVPPERIRTFLEAVSCDTVTLVDTGNKLLRIEAGKASYLVEFKPMGDFCPDSMREKLNRRKAKPIIVKGLATALSHVAYAMAVDDTRPVLAGTLLRFQESGGIELVACDAFRLARTYMKYKSELHFKRKDPRDFVVPKQAVSLICNLKSENYMFYIGDNYLEFHSGLVTIGVHPVDGQYPKYEQLIPDNKERLMFDRAETLAALKQFASSGLKDKSIRFEPKRGGVLVSAIDNDDHMVSRHIPGKSKLKIAFNPRFLKDLVTRVSETSVVLRVSDGKSPAVVKSAGVQHVIMPLFVQW